MIILRQREFAISPQTLKNVQSLKQQYPYIGSRAAYKAIKTNWGEKELGFVNDLKGRHSLKHATKKQLSKQGGFAKVGIFESQPKTFFESKNFSKGIKKFIKKAKKVDVGIFKRKTNPEEIMWIEADKPKKLIEPIKPLLTYYN